MEKVNYIAVVPQEEIEALKDDLNEVKELLYNMCNSSSEKHSDEWLTDDEVAKLFKITKRTLFQWRRQGLIEVSKVGRQVLIRKAEVDALLERNTLNSARATGSQQRNNKLNY